MFSDIKYKSGPDANGAYEIKRVPIMYGDPSSMVAQIIKGVSENTLMPSPMFSAYIEAINMDPTRRQDSQFVGKVSTMERAVDPITGQYTNQPGIRYDVERYMPVPYEMILKLDCWTTNTTTKFQIREQIDSIFNPSIQLQQNNNLLDWTSIFEVWMDNTTWTNRSVPQGGEIERDVMSWRFKVPVWINPPAKVKRSTLVAEIVTNVFSDVEIVGLEESMNGNYDAFRTSISSIPTQIITTEGNYKIRVERNNGQDEITLINADGSILPELSWQTLIAAYGQISTNITKIRLKIDPNIDISYSDVIGDITQDLDRKNVLIFTPDVDSLPATTILPISDIIDPVEVMPGDGLPAAVAGQRYLITSANAATNDLAIPPGVSTSPWGSGLIVYPNDIIEYNGIKWVVIFDSRNSTGTQYLVNNTTGVQYMFKDNVWSYTYYGEYGPGKWRIDNIIQTADGTIDVYE
jgi:hypothetical protein